MQNTAMLRANLLSSSQNASTRRLQKDYKELKESKIPLVGVSAAPLENDLFTWHANIKGPEGSAYYGGVFHVEIGFSQNYPM